MHQETAEKISQLIEQQPAGNPTVDVVVDGLHVVAPLDTVSIVNDMKKTIDIHVAERLDYEEINYGQE